MSETTQEHQLTFRNDMVQRNLRNMQAHLEKIAFAYGGTSTEYLLALTSLNNCLMRLFTFSGGGMIYADGELGLVLGGNMTIGMVFHPSKRDVDDYTAGEWSLHS